MSCESCRYQLAAVYRAQSFFGQLSSDSWNLDLQDERILKM